MTERFQPRRAVIFQVAFYRGWVRNVDLVSETFDMKEGEYAARIQN